MRRADKRLTVRLDDELARRFASFAHENALSDSDALRTLLAWALERTGDPVAKAALAIQSRFCAQVSKETAEFEHRVMAHLRALAPGVAA